MKRSAWARWMSVARRAAEIQAHLLFFLLYFLAMVPLGWVQPGARRAVGRKMPEWRPREAHSVDLAASQRQY